MRWLASNQAESIAVGLSGGSPLQAPLATSETFGLKIIYTPPPGCIKYCGFYQLGRFGFLWSVDVLLCCVACGCRSLRLHRRHVTTVLRCHCGDTRLRDAVLMRIS